MTVRGVERQRQRQPRSQPINLFDVPAVERAVCGLRRRCLCRVVAVTVGGSSLGLIVSGTGRGTVISQQFGNAVVGFSLTGRPAMTAGRQVVTYSEATPAFVTATATSHGTVDFNSMVSSTRVAVIVVISDVARVSSVRRIHAATLPVLRAVLLVITAERRYRRNRRERTTVNTVATPR